VIEWFGVAAGGFLGSCARLYITLRISRSWNKHFPLATFLINVTGAFLLGVISVAMHSSNLFDAWMRSTLGIGFLGAFTTFSTFMFESIELYDRRKIDTMIGYLLASLVFGFAGAYIGTLL
jgi:CrcB protein